jgi:HEAT repeat protein
MMQHVALKIIFVLALAATCFVVAMSFILVLRKTIEVKAKKVRYHLVKQYSSLFADILMQEIPVHTASTSMNERWHYYESTLTEQKKRLERMSKRTRLLHKGVMRSVLMDFSKDLKGETTERILYYIYSLKILDELMTMMNSPRWWVRASAAKELGLLHAKRTIDTLLAALEDPHPDVQFQAMQSLLIIEGVSALRSILQLSKSFSQWTAVELSVIILEYREEAAPFLLEALASPSPSVVLFSITMLAQIGSVSAVEPLIKLCSSDPEPKLYEAALEALGRLGDERALSLLLLNCQNPNPDIRLSAIQALGRLGAKKSIPIVTEWLLRGDINEMRIAARALGNMGEEGVSALYELLKSADDATRMIAREITEDIEQGRKL